MSSEANQAEWAIAHTIIRELEPRDSWWLVALERAVGDLPCREPNAFDYEINADQQGILDEYEQAYELVMEAYAKLLRSFSYKPRFAV